MRTINVTGGYTDYVEATVTERDGKDLSTATIKAALLPKTGTGAVPDATSPVWRTTTATGLATGTVLVALLIGAETAPGDYYLWIRVTDNPTIVPVRDVGTVRVI